MSTHYLLRSFYFLFFIDLQGSKDQLKEVWEETDGLDPNDFDPKTFFKLHGNKSDTNINIFICYLKNYSCLTLN